VTLDLDQSLVFLAWSVLENIGLRPYFITQVEADHIKKEVSNDLNTTQ